jgi:hypothetical protein
MAERRKRPVGTVALWTLVSLAGVSVIAFALVVGPWLFTRQPPGELTTEQELKARNDVRTTLVQALGGLAVAGGLIVTYRTYRQNQVEQDRTYDREVYAEAVRQLGHDSAAVRLVGLYSLDVLAQDSPVRRQAMVDVLCAYLRMPYTPPAKPNLLARGKVVVRDASRQSTSILPPTQDPAHELQVRQTVQRVLASHLRRPSNTSAEDAQRRPASPDDPFWAGISLDLTGATLVEFSLENASIVKATFSRATFTEDAGFDNATFADAQFDRGDVHQ